LLLVPGTIGLFACPAVAEVAAGQEITATPIASNVVGECACDTATYRTTCTYTVFSGRPALSHLIFPLPANCVGRYTISSPWFVFSAPQDFDSRWCGKIFGLKADQELPEGQVTSFTITYVDVCSLAVGTVYVGLKGGTECEMFAVPGVVDCPFVRCVKWSFDGTGADFRIKKPGIYAGRIATMRVFSNVESNISFESFGDLVSTTDPSNGVIAAFYAATPATQANPPAEFLSPADFNNSTLAVPADQEYECSLWSKIVVETAARACDYHGVATVRLVLVNHTVWVDDGP
jgi:hypothetical protein